MDAYQCDENGIYIGVVKRQISPLEDGVFLLPAGATDIEPPAIPSGKQARFDGKGWLVEDIPEPVLVEVIDAPILTEEELVMRQKIESEKLATRESAIEKLIHLGLTVDEVQALLPI